MISFFSIDAAQPELIRAALGIKIAGPLSSRDAAIPLFEHKVSATKQIVGFRVSGCAVNSLPQSLNRIIDAAGGEQFLGRRIAGGRPGAKNKQKHG